MKKEQLEKYITANPFMQLSKAIHDLLLNEIATNNLKPGSKINVAKIASDLGVSRSPVLKGIEPLIESNLIIKPDNKGSLVVSNLSGSEAYNLFTARAAIEVKAAYLCAERTIAPDIIEKMHSLASKYLEFMYTLKDDSLSDEHRYYNDNFHKLILENCGNPYLQEFFSSIEKKLLRYRLLINNSAGLKQSQHLQEQIANQHIIIVEAIKSNIPDIAAKAMDDHMNLGMTYVMSILGND